MTQRFLSLRQCAADIGKNPRTVARWIRAHRIPVVAPSRGTILVPRTSWDAFLQRMTINPNPR